MTDRWRDIRWRNYVWWSIPAAIAALLVWTTVFTGRRHPVIRSIRNAVPYADKVGHVVLYGALTASVVVLIRLGGRSGWAVVATAATVFGLGVLDEIRQVDQAFRTFSIPDLSANGVGVVLGALAGVGVAYGIDRFRHDEPPT